MPTFRSADTVLYRARRRIVPPLPTIQSEVVILPPYTTSLNNGRFFQCGMNNNDILIFTTQENVNALVNAQVIFMDGTFKTVPQLYKQLFVIHDIVGERLMPRVYALMAHKDVQSYSAVFQWLNQFARQSQLEIRPQTVVSDFESSLHAALLQDLPDSQNHGCYFHFTQAVWRKFQTLGLVPLYNIDEDVRHVVRKLFALALLPLAAVRNAFVTLQYYDIHPAINAIFQCAVAKPRATCSLELLQRRLSYK